MNFTRETEDDDWAGTIDILGKSYALSIRASYEPDELDQITSRAKDFLESNWRRIIDQLSAELLPMYNDQWRDDDEPLIQEAEFLAALGDPDVNVWEEEAIMLNYSDGGLFGGHYIEVFIESPESGRTISVGLVG